MNISIIDLATNHCVAEYAEFFFALIVERFVGLYAVLLGLLDYMVVCFCAYSWLFYDEVGDCGVVDFPGLF